MLSKKAKYALKALQVLAEEYNKGPLLIATIAERQHIPKKFLEVILLSLKHEGILGSKKGQGGGYYLIKDPAEVKMIQVVRTIDGPVALIPCVSEKYYEKCEECEDEVTCGIRQVAQEVREATVKILGATSLADVLRKEANLKRTQKIKK
jgi:Rrf2 family protein